MMINRRLPRYAGNRYGFGLGEFDRSNDGPADGDTGGGGSGAAGGNSGGHDTDRGARHDKNDVRASMRAFGTVDPSKVAAGTAYGVDAEKHTKLGLLAGLKAFLAGTLFSGGNVAAGVAAGVKATVATTRTVETSAAMNGGGWGANVTDAEGPTYSGGGPSSGGSTVSSGGSIFGGNSSSEPPADLPERRTERRIDGSAFTSTSGGIQAGKPFLTTATSSRITRTVHSDIVPDRAGTIPAQVHTINVPTPKTSAVPLLLGAAALLLL